MAASAQVGRMDVRAERRHVRKAAAQRDSIPPATAAKHTGTGYVNVRCREFGGTSAEKGRKAIDRSDFIKKGKADRDALIAEFNGWHDGVEEKEVEPPDRGAAPLEGAADSEAVRLERLAGQHRRCCAGSPAGLTETPQEIAAHAGNRRSVDMNGIFSANVTAELDDYLSEGSDSGWEEEPGRFRTPSDNEDERPTLVNDLGARLRVHNGNEEKAIGEMLEDLEMPTQQRGTTGEYKAVRRAKGPGGGSHVAAEAPESEGPRLRVCTPPPKSSPPEAIPTMVGDGERVSFAPPAMPKIAGLEEAVRAGEGMELVVENRVTPVPGQGCWAIDDDLLRALGDYVKPPLAVNE